MSELKEMSPAIEFRMEIAEQILGSMAANEEFPIGNMRRIANIMQEYFESEGFNDLVYDAGYRWQPNEAYWEHKFKDIRRFLRDKRKLFLEYERTDLGVGSWGFLRKGEFEKVMQKEHDNLMTRTNTYNDRCEDGHKKWKLSNPMVRTVPFLPEAL